MLNTLSKKEARAIFVKFLLENNCLRQFVACYRAYHKCDSSPDYIIDKVITRTKSTGYDFTDILSRISISFDWMDDNVVSACRKIDRMDCAIYWSKINKKFQSFNTHGKIVGE
jgi:hypothetical protein